jgi:hypothetical protein
VRKALESLPWVEKGSVRPDTRTQRVRFAVTDKAKFNLDEVRTVITQKGFRVGRVLAGP